MNTRSTAPSIKKPFFNHLLPFTICALASLFYVYEFFLRVTPGAITHELMHEFHLDAKGLGFMSALFYYGYTPMQIPAGLLMDRFGPRILMTLSMALCAAGAFLFGAGHSAAFLSSGRFIMGFASSFAFVGALVLASRWFPAKYFALITGIIQLMGCVGAIIGEAPVAMLASSIGWRVTLMWAAAIGAVLTLLFWLIIRDAPPGHSTDPIAPETSNSLMQEWHRLRYICRNPQTWFTGICGFACWGPVVTFAALWGVPFLMADYHITSAAASAATSVMWIGVAIASPLVGWWSNAIRSRRTPLIVSGILGLFASLGVIYIPHPPWWAMYTLLFFFGAAAAAQAITFGLVQDNNPSSVEGTAIGFNNMAVIFGGMSIQPLTGVMIKAFWDGHMAHGVPVYSFAAYEKALFLLPACSVILLVTTVFFIKETHCEVQYNNL